MTVRSKGVGVLLVFYFYFSLFLFYYTFASLDIDRNKKEKNWRTDKCSIILHNEYCAVFLLKKGYKTVVSMFTKNCPLEIRFPKSGKKRKLNFQEKRKGDQMKGNIWVKNLVSPDGDILYKKEYQAFEQVNEKGYALMKNAYKVYRFKNVSIPKELSDSDVGKFFRLEDYLYKDNSLRIKRNNRQVPINRNDLAKIWKVSDKQVRNIVNNLKDYGLLCEATFETMKQTVKVFYVNPLYMMVGLRVNKSLYDLFKDQLANYIPQWAVNEMIEIEERKNNG